MSVGRHFQLGIRFIAADRRRRTRYNRANRRWRDGRGCQDAWATSIRIQYRGGLSLAQVAEQPAELINPFFLRGPGLTGPRDPFAPPEQAKAYPEPSMFGLLPAYGFFIRHAKNISLEGVEVGFTREDGRPPLVLQDVAGFTASGLKAQRGTGVSMFVLKVVTDFKAVNCPGFPDLQRAQVAAESL